jgi:Ca2+/Na+ antiporter
MLQADSWNLGTSIAVFVAAALVIALCGVLLTERAEHLARRTGLGEALTGALFLGAITSLAGTITSVSAALDGFPEIAFGNAVGGIAAQTTFIVVADLVYRKHRRGSLRRWSNWRNPNKARPPFRPLPPASGSLGGGRLPRLS